MPPPAERPGSLAPSLRSRSKMIPRASDHEQCTCAQFPVNTAQAEDMALRR